MEVQTLTFSLEWETKNTVRYTERTDGKPPGDHLCSEVGHRPKPTKDLGYQGQRGLRIVGQLDGNESDFTS